MRCASDIPPAGREPLFLAYLVAHARGETGARSAADWYDVLTRIKDELWPRAQVR